jgi:hypothetical protein
VDNALLGVFKKAVLFRNYRRHDGITKVSSLPKGVNFLPKRDPPVLASNRCHFYAMLALNSVDVMPSVLATWGVTPVVDMTFPSLTRV